MNPQEAAQYLLEEFGTLVLLGMPPGTEFGIDLNTWNVGEKFKGVKMIPPGLHFIYFSAVNKEGDTAPRTGFFHYFESKEMVVRHYDATTEDLRDEGPTPGELERFRLNLQNLDRYLGPYPMESWKKWVSLIQYIAKDDLDRLLPLSGRICSAPELTVVQEEQQKKGPSTATADDVMSSQAGSSITSEKDTEDESPEKNRKRLKGAPSSSHSMPEMVPKPGTELRFSKFPGRPYRDGATPHEITHYSLDSSYSVRKIIDAIGRIEGLLAELQFAFVCFLVGQVWDGWEHWRRLLTSLCSAEELLLEQHPIYLKLLSIIHFQVQEVPEDLFVDIVESNNFLAASLKVLFANISDSSSSLPPALVTKAQRFRHHLSLKFGWELTMEDDGEDAPSNRHITSLTIRRGYPL